ncbi:hypothetical protein RBH26_19975 [Natronolimnohabitans sp. A-GB9]|uniref:hypothetical protein n=1 Tax=Natronolimnohabitans sp. A-GB9 TaxID=3069757 RepID=UPI0027B238D4|nr:hypothetical protein [Natronolimnohabitans sp. A-GB9]MDQ2052725.1 hypothetical protein [Natronolimnohabitans sp. A-GB9]
MPDDNRFAGLREAVDEPDAESDEAPSSEADSTTEIEYESAVTDSETDAGSEPDEADSESTDPDDPTAFPFDATEKKTVYVRPETLADLEDAQALVDAQLRTDHDVRDLTGREFYDAVFQLAADDTDGLIEAILEARDD